MAEFLSFEKLLRKWLRKIQPEYILEWGMGHSTKIMLEECPDAKIDTFEHDINWFKKYYEVLRPHFKNVNTYYFPLDKGYATFPYRHYDLIFIDGRMRVECMKTSKKIIDNEGVVILHDSERERYKEGIKLFTILEESEGTTVMKK